MSEDQRRRVVEARGRLRERFLERMRATPGLSDPRPLGSGPLNRHGMPRLPVGQTVATNWPVLDLGEKPDVPIDRWALTIDGAVEAPLKLNWGSFLELPQTDDQSDFHCVTTWSLLDSAWRGVRVSALLALARPTPEATHLLTHGYDGYTTNLALEEALKDDVLVVHTWNGQPLPKEHGGPARIITPQLYAWKGAKWVSRLEVLVGDRPGFWEVRGYSNTANPWRDDRYS